ncbi:MAG TPA: transporter substrate-binding domain-containing protein [Actinomycetota bacterium]|nr:transporter substrate-binding domain-containing protein [Actinomycetota bacterium]
MRVGIAIAGAVALLAVAGACGFPHDPEGTLERVRGGVLRTGVTASPPWVLLGPGGPRGVEVTLVEQLAAETGATVEWVEGSEESLLAALELRELDLVVGGLTSTNPWAGKITLTHPYLTTAAVIAVPQGAEVPEDIAGVEVAAETGTEIAGLLEKTDARIRIVDDIADAPGAAAIDNYLVDDLDLVDTGVRLAERDHVWAVASGENAWLTHVERFLLVREDEILNLLDEVAP